LSISPEPPDAAYLWDIRRAAREIRSFVGERKLEDYLSDRLLQMAVERELEIVGEAANRLTSDFKERYPQIPWHAIVGQRNVLAHEYGRIQHRLIWEAATEGIPRLLDFLDDFELREQ
jgi:uncharacterized protein with HEPN domain